MRHLTIHPTSMGSRKQRYELSTDEGPNERRGAFGAVACNADKLNVPNYNAPTVDGLSKDPNGVQLVASAMTIQQRGNIAATFATSAYSAGSVQLLPDGRKNGFELLVRHRHGRARSGSTRSASRPGNGTATTRTRATRST